MTSKSVSSRAFYFCEVDFGARLTGIEHAALQRADLFVRELGVVPCMLTAKLNLSGEAHWRHLQALGKVNPQVPLRNVYDEVMRVSDGAHRPPATLSWPAGWTARDVEGGRHQRILDEQGRLRRYVVWCDASQQRLDYINYFEAGRRFQRDKFNRYGQLAVSQQLDDQNQVLSDTCFSPDGRRRLARWMEAATGRVERIHRFDDAGLLADQFTSESALLAWWLVTHVAGQGDVYLIDKHRTWAAPLQTLRQHQSPIVVSMIHAVHLGKSDRDAMTAPLNRHYRDVLEGTWPVDACVVLTPQQQRDVAMRFPQAGYRLAVIPHSVDLPPRRVPVSQRSPRRLVALTRLSPEKRVSHMVRIMQALVQVLPDCTLHIHGEGAERAALTALIDECGLQAHVFLAGYADEVGPVLEQAACFLQTSEVEGFGMAILESLAHGCPVLAYDVPYGPASLVRTGWNGWLVADGDAAAAARILADALRRPEDMQALSSHAYETAQAYQSPPLAQAWRTLLADLGA